jgi:peroxiredoxin Q/BCP
MKRLTMLIAVLMGWNVPAAELKVGDSAPAFEAPDDTGKTWKSSDYVGKKAVVVYFYPADMTPGCTKQACSYRDDMSALADKGIVVVGVSGDSVNNHQIFKKAYKLNYTLLADEKGEVAKAFGVPTKKGGTIKRTVDGAEVELTRGVTAMRWTIVIGKDGKVLDIATKVNAPGDSTRIAKILEGK